MPGPGLDLIGEVERAALRMRANAEIVLHQVERLALAYRQHAA